MGRERSEEARRRAKVLVPAAVYRRPQMAYRPTRKRLDSRRLLCVGVTGKDAGRDDKEAEGLNYGARCGDGDISRVVN